MSRVIIGMDPHKRSATIEVMASDETVAGGGLVWHRCCWVPGHADGGETVARAGLGNRGLPGHRPAHREPAAGRGRRRGGCAAEVAGPHRGVATGQGCKTGATDAHSVALAATRMPGLRRVADDQQLAVLRILAGRRRSLGEDDTRMISQLHRLLPGAHPRRGQKGPVRGPGQSIAGPCPPA
jgi:transposase